MIRFQGTMIYADPTVATDRITFYYGNAGLQEMDKMVTVRLTEDTTEGDRLAKEMADRLLNRGPVLTLDMLQRAYDTALTGHSQIKVMIMHPDMRRQYLALLDADSRYGESIEMIDYTS